MLHRHTENNSKKPEHIIIIGGGYTGALSAILLAKVKNEQGAPLYSVTLLEEKKNLFDGASLTPARLHLGGEYPLDPITAQECLDGAIRFKQMLPEFVYTNEPPVKYLLSKQTEKEGQLTLKKMEEQYERVSKKYKIYYTELQKKYGERTAKKFFGKPEDFFRILPAEEITEPSRFAGGIQTQEPGLHPIKLGTFLEEELKRHNVRVLTRHQVMKAQEIKDGIGLIVKKGASLKGFYADQVINASWQNSLALSADIKRNKDQKVWAYLRSIAIADISKCKEKPGPIFTMLGKNGGMYSPFNDKIALLYLPDDEGAYVDQAVLDNATPSPPKSWGTTMEEGATDEERRKRSTLQKLKKIYPFLEGAKIIRMITRPTLAISSNIQQRRHINVDHGNTSENWINAISTKATLAPLAALEVLQKVQNHSLQKERIKSSDVILPKQGIPLLLPADCVLHKNTPSPAIHQEQLINFAKNRNLPTEIIAERTEKIPKKEEHGRSEERYFVVIHSAPDISPSDSLKGTHVHTIKKALTKKTEHSTKRSFAKIPPYTLLQHGTFKDMEEGNFDTSTNESSRKKNIGGDIGIASHASPIEGRLTLNDEAIIINGDGYLGTYDGHGRKMLDDDAYSFLQTVSLNGAAKLDIPKAKNIQKLVEEIQTRTPGTQSFAAYFKATVPTHTLVSRTIRGRDDEGKRLNNLKEIWKGWRVHQGDAPSLSHVLQAGGEKEGEEILIKSPVYIVPIHKFLVADKEKGTIRVGKYNYRDPKKVNQWTKLEQNPNALDTFATKILSERNETQNKSRGTG